MANPDKCYLIKRSKASEPNDVKKNPMDEVKTALRELTSEQKNSKNLDDRAAFMQEWRFDNVRFLQEALCLERSSDSETISDKNRDTESEVEFITATGSDMEEEPSEKRSIESKRNEEMTSSSEEEMEIEKKKRVAIKRNKNKKK